MRAAFTTDDHPTFIQFMYFRVGDTLNDTAIKRKITSKFKVNI